MKPLIHYITDTDEIEPLWLSILGIVALALIPAFFFTYGFIFL